MNLVIKVKPKVVSKPRKSPIISKKIKGKIILDEEGYRVEVKNDNSLEVNYYKLTENSYSISGKEIVFSKTKDKKGNYITYCRGKDRAKYFGISEEVYLPFRPGWIVTGNIIKNNEGNLLFDFKDILHPEGWINADIKDE